MGNASSVSMFCAARDADYATIVTALRVCFPYDVAEMILDHFDWAYDTRFECTTKPLDTSDEIRITTICIKTYRDSTFSYYYKHMSRDFFGDTEVSEDYMNGMYSIQHKHLVLNGNMTRNHTVYNQTFDEDSSMRTIPCDESCKVFSRTDLRQYEKNRLCS